jgi:hypothetical protein
VEIKNPSVFGHRSSDPLNKENLAGGAIADNHIDLKAEQSLNH